MYVFRKPFTAASFGDTMLWGIGFKTVLVTAQVLGYTISKFVGIKVIAEMPPGRRAVFFLVLIGVAELALLMFGLTPAPYNFIWLFVNGLPLGMVFGLVIGFLEGRLQTELLTAGLCASFIVADGAAKSVGTFLLDQGISQYWMPFVAGLLFVPPLLWFVWMLSRIPPPTARDVQARSQRTTMNRSERWAFFHRYRLGLVLLVMSYLLITVLRSVRADFAPEIWRGLGATITPSVFTRSESLVAFLVIVLNSLAVIIANNRWAFSYAMLLSIGGAGLVAVSLVCLQAGQLSPFAFMVLNGLGLYLPYIAVHTTVFERLIAMTRDRGNIGYLIYLADAFGYLGYVVVMLIRNYMVTDLENFLPFFLGLSWVIAGGCIVLLVPCWRYFVAHAATQVVPPIDSPSSSVAAID